MAIARINIPKTVCHAGQEPEYVGEIQIIEAQSASVPIRELKFVFPLAAEHTTALVTILARQKLPRSQMGDDFRS